MLGEGPPSNQRPQLRAAQKALSGGGILHVGLLQPRLVPSLAAVASRACLWLSAVSLTPWEPPQHPPEAPEERVALGTPLQKGARPGFAGDSPYPISHTFTGSHQERQGPSCGHWLPPLSLLLTAPQEPLSSGAFKCYFF